jgi:primosomal protein N' (replication factor Y)
VYADVSLPVPLARAFTYRVPPTLEHRVQPGCRVSVPFAGRLLTGMVVSLHPGAPEAGARDIARLLDEEPVLDEDLLKLGAWIANYYCAPPGEVFRAMTPLGGEVHRRRVFTLTAAGRETARQLVIGDLTADRSLQILRLLEARPLAEATIKAKVEGASNLLRTLERKGFIALQTTEEERDPLRAASGRLRVEFTTRPEVPKLRRAERELLAYLELHPGPHNLKSVEDAVKGAGPAARSLGRRGLLKVEPELPAVGLALRKTGPRPERILTAAQSEACARIREALDAGGYRAFLLEGVTGSGKTEVYLRSIEACLEKGKNALMLVPEIGLTPAVAAQFFERFGEGVAILHSAIGGAERAGQWRRLREGRARVAVATRSGVFAPLQHIGLIVVDEEHDQSYKQQDTPRYHGRDVALVRALDLGACVVLGSATPSLESRYNAERGKYTRLVLAERVENRPLPKVEIVDMRAEFLETRRMATFSRRLAAAIAERLERGEQTMLLMNRRGFSSFAACRKCGERVECPNCAVTLTFHRRERRMLCHYCGYAERPPERCPKCDSEHIQFLGSGSERVEDELRSAFPKARVARLDRDTVTGKGSFERILAAFRSGQYDILTGTQMIAKGHDIANVTLVGIVSADIGLSLPDFRAAERTFQLLTQAAGRAGRGGRPGEVLIQTLNPDHYAIRFAAEQNYTKFYEKEAGFRQAMRYPPFAVLANIVIRSERKDQAEAWAAELGRLLEPSPAGVKVLGPAPAPVARIRGEHRYQMLIKAASRNRLSDILASIRHHAAQQKWPAAALLLDVDPLTLL